MTPAGAPPPLLSRERLGFGDGALRSMPAAFWPALQHEGLLAPQVPVPPSPLTLA